MTVWTAWRAASVTLLAAVFVSGCGKSVSDQGFGSTVQVTVEGDDDGDGEGTVVNTVDPARSGFKIDCAIRDGSTREPLGSATYRAGCQSDFDDADAAGQMALRITPGPGHIVESLGGSCQEVSGTVCSMPFSTANRNEDFEIELLAVVRLDPLAPTTITLAPASSEVAAGETVTLTATVLDQVGDAMTEADLEWSSGNVAVATVSPSGSVITADVTGVSQGVSTISATAPNGTSGEATVMVTAPGNVVIFSNMESADLWMDTVRYATNGVTSVETHPTSGGQAGAYRRIEHVFPDSGQINVFHGYVGETYSPSVDGAIERLSYSEFRRLIEPNSGSVGARFALMQDGAVYYYKSGEAFDNVDWASVEANDLTAADFGPGAGPDFSASGAEITFGFLRSNTRRTASAATIVHGTDEFRVVIQR